MRSKYGKMFQLLLALGLVNLSCAIKEDHGLMDLMEISVKKPSEPVLAENEKIFPARKNRAPRQQRWPFVVYGGCSARPRLIENIPGVAETVNVIGPDQYDEEDKLHQFTEADFELNGEPSVVDMIMSSLHHRPYQQN
ncbi:uncharacterized protein LOC118437579 [Folsomia candida]|uniref:Uncharacterized protein n=1 Tax=Folsomia candida TaxID=158441 RepID=A0A226DNP4_FOLCA|nr:uncharacterized protein LOC118437579 [Folsomia candida]OXA46853.1 hypothetical protein Fcan01_18119 [Folsomia candida]